MSGLITIKSNLPAIQEGLGTLAARLGRIQPALKGIGQTLELSTRDRFDQEVDPKGRKWQASAASTLKRKGKKGKSLKILHQDMNLRDTIHSQTDATSLIIGSPQKYAAIQQLGGKAGRKKRVKIPPRPYLGISEQDEKDIQDDIRQYLEKAVEAAGRGD